VVIVGVGGIGSLVAVNLTTAGVGRLTLVDDDHVELSNLTRQLLYTESSVGQPKVTVAAQQLSARNHTVHIDALAQPVVDPEILPPADLWLVSADTRGLIPVINRHAVTTGTPWLHACYVNDIAAYGPLVVPGVSGCWDCADFTATHPAPTPELASAIHTVGAGFQAPSFGPINMLVSALASLDAIRFLGAVGTPESWNRRVGVHTAPELRLEHQLCPRDAGCVSCGDDQHD
jgi:bacteriocin biosynthesis cyclodehydratase domain-containing protein